MCARRTKEIKRGCCPPRKQSGNDHGPKKITRQGLRLITQNSRLSLNRSTAMKRKGKKSAAPGMSRREWLYTAAGAAAVPALPPVAPQTSKLRLTMSCWDYDRTRALMESRVSFDGIDLTYLPLVVEETFFRMLRYHEFDVAEMSLSSYVLSLFADKPQFIAIPIFPSRMFRHSNMYVSANSGIREPKDLIGKRVGTPEYQLT